MHFEAKIKLNFFVEKKYMYSPCNVIRRIKESVKIPVIVGGGIRDYGKARSIIDAGKL